MWTLIEWWAAFVFFFGGAAAIFCMACDVVEEIKRWRSKRNPAETTEPAKECDATMKCKPSALPDLDWPFDAEEPPEPAKECEHDWHRELVGPDPSGESVAVDTCRKCQRKEVGRDLA